MRPKPLSEKNAPRAPRPPFRYAAERASCAVLAALFLGLFFVLAARALSPRVRIVQVGAGGPGELTIYNDSPRAGYEGLPLELGDLDGDGFTDLVISAMRADVQGNPVRVAAGEIYVYPGDGRIEGVIDRSRLGEGDRSLTIRGARAGDYLGTEVFTADVDGDGIEDLLFSAQNHDGTAGDRDNAGAAYVLLGRPGLFAERRTIDLARPPEELAAGGVITLLGPEPGGRLGIWVEAGDLDGDGSADILAGADQIPAPAEAPRRHAGCVFVVYGRNAFPPLIDLSLPNEGVARVCGRDPEDHFGASLHARDLDGDGRAELIAGAGFNRLSAGSGGETAYEAHAAGGGDGPGNERPEAGEVVILFSGKAGERLPPALDLAALPEGLRGRVTTIYGPSDRAVAGEEIATGDFDGDGVMDLAIGALTEDLGRGSVHLVYGPVPRGIEIDLAEPPRLPRPANLQLTTLAGLHPGDILGDTLAAADFDHDGIDDLAVGIPHWDPDPETDLFDDRGAVALVFGRPERLPRYLRPQADILPPRVRIAFVVGKAPMDLLSYSMEARDFDRDGFADLFTNAMRGEPPGAPPDFDSGEAHLLSGVRVSGAELAVREVRPPGLCPGVSAELDILGEGFTTVEETTVTIAGERVERFQVRTSRWIRAEFQAPREGGALEVTVLNRYGEARLPEGVRILSPQAFTRGDVYPNGRIDIGDAGAILFALFTGSELPCEDAADADDDGAIGLTDAVWLLEYLFRSGPKPPAPFPAPGLDPTADALGCCP